ncbi:MAG: hypothetical protein ABI469_05040 [Gemmatimonadales bacterium]
MSIVHLHLALTHLPVMGAAFALLLFIGVLYRNAVSLKFALWFLGGLGAAALIVYLTGEPAADAIEKLPGVSGALIEEHEDSALIATIFTGVLGVLALLMLFVYRQRTAPRWVAVSGLGATMALSAVMAWTANLGGQIRHTEIRAGNAAATQQLERRSGDGEGDR